MRNRRALFLLAAGVVGIIVLVNLLRQWVLPSSVADMDGVAVQQSYRLNHAVGEDLVVLAEVIDLEAESQVSGDTALIGGVMDVAGQLNGDLTALGERIVVQQGAQISGDAVLLVSEARVEGTIQGELNIRGEQVTLSPDARVSGDVFVCASTLVDERADAAPVRPCAESAVMNDLRPLEALRNLSSGTITLGAVGLVFSLLGTLGLSGLSVLAVAVFPRQISHIEEAIRTRPRGQAAAGFMVVLLLAGVSFVYAVIFSGVPLLGLVLLPFYLIFALLFLGMAITGWVTLSLIFGDLIVSRFPRAALPPLITAAVGNVVLVVLWHLLALTTPGQFVGLLALVVLTSVGVGAALTTRLGTKPVYRSYLIQG